MIEDLSKKALNMLISSLPVPLTQPDEGSEYGTPARMESKLRAKDGFCTELLYAAVCIHPVLPICQSIKATRLRLQECQRDCLQDQKPADTSVTLQRDGTTENTPWKRALERCELCTIL